jgi:hypothetical protein
MTLEEFRALVKASTPGPWWNDIWDVHSSRVHICEVQTTGAETEPAPVKDTFIFHEDGRVTTKGGSQLADISQEEAETNAAFIAAMRNHADLFLELWEAAEAYEDFGAVRGETECECSICFRCHPLLLKISAVLAKLQGEKGEAP